MKGCFLGPDFVTVIRFEDDESWTVLKAEVTFCGKSLPTEFGIRTKIPSQSHLCSRPRFTPFWRISSTPTSQSLTRTPSPTKTPLYMTMMTFGFKNINFYFFLNCQRNNGFKGFFIVKLTTELISSLSKVDLESKQDLWCGAHLARFPIFITSLKEGVNKFITWIISTTLQTRE